MIVTVDVLLPPMGTGLCGSLALGDGGVLILVTAIKNVSFPSLSVSLIVLTIAHSGPWEPAGIVSWTEPATKSGGPEKRERNRLL